MIRTQSAIIRKHLAALNEFSGTVKEYAVKNGLRASDLYRWKYRDSNRKRANPKSPETSFAKTIITEVHPKTVPVAPVVIKFKSGMEIQLPVTGSDAVIKTIIESMK